jgi:hypothetical protein
MALSMEERRILAEIEEQLSRAEPGLAARLAAFRGPGLGGALRSPRARFAVSLAALIGVLVVSVTLYAFAAMRVMNAQPPDRSPARQQTSLRAPQAKIRARVAADTARAHRARGGPAGSGR